MKRLHLVCNAHIDPLWLWELEEGISATLSTFRVAVEFCDIYDGYVFNHNEAMLYEWVEEYEPELFEKIRRLVKEGKWHIMGGWYLQPDCNMPSGESFIRQIKVGREYFKEKFGVEPTTAINFDPFGHSRGLVQILKKTGYDSYLFCRPYEHQGFVLPDDDFVWVGFDGSKIMAHRASEAYSSLLGQAGEKVSWKLTTAKKGSKDVDILLWGVGNHGGGPSRIDMKDIQDIMDAEKEWEVVHSTPEAFFAERKAAGRQEPEVFSDLNPWAVGCYTSQIRIKQKHRLLEGNLSKAEKMVSAARLKGLLSSDTEAERKDAEKALLLSEFHDVLPGSGIKPVEEQGLRFLEHGLEMTDRMMRKAYFALLSEEPKASEGEYPILAYNPHPYPLHGIFSVDFLLSDQNWTESYAMPVLYMNGEKLFSQVEKEESNLNLDWGKKVIFEATLPPASMSRISCYIEWQDKKPEKELPVGTDCYEFRNDRLKVTINKATGLMDSFEMDGIEYIKQEAGKLVVMESDKDPWGMFRKDYSNKIGEFTLMNPEEAAEYASTPNQIEGVRVIEDGPVRTVIEALFHFRSSKGAIRYYLPKQGTAVEVECMVNWAEKGAVLKLELPTMLAEGTPMGETAFGVMEYEADRKEKVGHRWNGIFDFEKDIAFTCINSGTYGMDFSDGVIRISMIHSAAYAAHPIEGRPLLVEDRALSYIDQGERRFRFRLEAGKANERRALICAAAMEFQETPMVFQVFPPGENRNPKLDTKVPLITLSDKSVVLSSMRQEGEEYRIRLFETTGQNRSVKVTIPSCNVEQEVALGAYEVRTYLLRATEGKLYDSERM